MSDKEKRKSRFKNDVRATQVLISCINRMIDENEGKIKTRDEAKENDLDQLVAGLFGKASKTFYATTELALQGHGEDALVLLRTNINLLINLTFILKDDSVTRAGNLIAYSFLEQKKYIELNGEEKPEWFERLPWEELKQRATIWRKMKIEERAKEADQSLHYNVGYRFYSSIEHSDAWSVSNYIEGKGSGTVHINSAPSDKYVSVALEHNFAVMANVLHQMCRNFSIPFSNYEAEINAAYESLHIASEKEARAEENTQG